ncbi:hypothetical protein [Haloplanus halobius]|uniref:hypothetical protein n=1 Tax=Haloplanus halobius TaxID=2934938 RepID=UPI00200C08EE|nr:hypothetical protein [Haloplanus sp. XH21]
MANDPDPETQVSVSTGEVRVEKTFEADRFPVPAIAFEIESLVDYPVRIRLVDQIPESFAMEGVGFHPDYDSDHWTAYRDHRVAYERTFDPGEDVLTVYGIRIDDPEEAAAFLGEPTVELVEVEDGDDAGDVLGRETTQVVRDALSGESDGELSGLESEPDSILDDAPEPRSRDEGLETVMGARDEDVSAVETEEEDDTVSSAEAAAALDPRDGVDAEAETADAEEADAGVGAAEGAAAGSVAATLAAELRSGDVDDDDLAVLQDAFDGELPTSADARISRLQSQIEDLLAYRDALADFLDEKGTAEEMVDEVSDEVSALADRVASLEESLAAADDDREDLHDELTALSDTTAELSDRIDSVDDQLSGVETRMENVDDRLTTVESFRSDIDDIESELDEIQDELSDVQTFRERLNSAFGPGEE